MNANRGNGWTLPLVLYPVWLVCTLAAILSDRSSLILTLNLITTALLGLSATYSIPDHFRPLKLPMYLICLSLATVEGFALKIQTMQEPETASRAFMLRLSFPDGPEKLHDLFMTDFADTKTFSFDTNNTVRDSEDSRTVTGHVYSAAHGDVRIGARFYAFYIPRVQGADVSFQLARSLVDAPRFVDAELRSVIRGKVSTPDYAALVDIEILPFSGIMYVYHEDQYSAEQVKTLNESFANSGLKLNLRDVKYAIERRKEWAGRAPRLLK